MLTVIVLTVIVLTVIVLTVIVLTAVSYTHLRAHETSLHLVCRLLLEKTLCCGRAVVRLRCAARTRQHQDRCFFNDTATTEIYTLHIVGSVRCV